MPLREGQVFEIEIADVNIRGRHRQELGDLKVLADSIEAIGLLHPIGVDADDKLIFGERRLRACRDFLKRKTILARRLDVDRLTAELAENDVRKDLNLSERFSLMQAIEKAMPKRVGRPGNEKVANSPQLDGEKTRDLSAAKAGFASAHEARAVEAVIDAGSPALIEMMDKRDVAPSAAATVAALPKRERERVIKEGPKAVKQAAARVRREKLLTAAERETDEKETLRKKTVAWWTDAIVKIGVALATIEKNGGAETAVTHFNKNERQIILKMIRRDLDKYTHIEKVFAS